MTDRVPPDGGTRSNTNEMMTCTPEYRSYIQQNHEKPNTLVKKVVREFDRGTRGRFLRKAVPRYGGCWVPLSLVRISCVTIEPDRSYVIDRYSAPRSEGPKIFASTAVSSERLKMTTVPGVYVSICSTSMAEIVKT